MTSRRGNSWRSQRHCVERFFKARPKPCRPSLTWRPGTGPSAPPWAAVIGHVICLASANRVNNTGGRRVEQRVRLTYVNKTEAKPGHRLLVSRHEQSLWGNIWQVAWEKTSFLLTANEDYFNFVFFFPWTLTRCYSVEQDWGCSTRKQAPISSADMALLPRSGWFWTLHIRLSRSCLSWAPPPCCSSSCCCPRCRRSTSLAAGAAPRRRSATMRPHGRTRAFARSVSERLWTRLTS